MLKKENNKPLTKEYFENTLYATLEEKYIFY